MDLKHKASMVSELLDSEYGKRKLKKRDPMDTLIITILSQNTSSINTRRAFENLKKKYKTWDELLKADVKEMSDTIRVGGLGNIKTKRIKASLEEIKKRTGTLDLSFLSRLSVNDAKKFLYSLKGVGPKTAACVLIFSFGMSALPVDTHIFRISKRLGFINGKTSVRKAHDELESIIDSKNTYSFHLNMITHGRKICKQKPLCDVCALTDVCDYFETKDKGTRR